MEKGKTRALTVTSGLRAGKLAANHPRGLLKVRTGLKAGGITENHSRAALTVRTGLKASKI
jgi:hypothetical protein